MPFDYVYTERVLLRVIQVHGQLSKRKCKGSKSSCLSAMVYRIEVEAASASKLRKWQLAKDQYKCIMFRRSKLPAIPVHSCSHFIGQSGKRPLNVML